MEYLPETLVSRSRARHNDKGILLEVNDTVHSSLDIFLRKATICNRSAKRQRIRVFFTQDFHIYGDSVGDTVMYDSILKSIIHFKRKRYFLVSGNTSQRGSIFQIAQGSVDSVVSFEIELDPGSEGMVYYWSAWSNRKEVDMSILPQEVVRMLKRSLLIMRAHADSGGGIIASCDSDILQFSRDVEFVEGVYQNLVVKATEFLLEYRDPWTGLPRPSFDLWEEKTGVFTWTVSTVYAALKAAERFARVFYDKSRQEG